MENQTSDNLIINEMTEEILLIQHIRSDVLSLTYNYFSEEGYMLVDPPLLHEQVKNKKSEIYLPIYNEKYSLNSSNALFMGAYASLFGSVYSISTCFRDEQLSINHLLEFKMLEVEVVNCSFDVLIEIVEKYIIFVLDKLYIKYFQTKVGTRIAKLMTLFKSIKVSYKEFISSINQKQEYKVDYGVDLSSIDYIISKYIKNPIFITDYPFPLATWTAKPKTNKIAYAFNLILPDSFGELAEGCERNNNTDMLKYKFKCAGIDNLQWYLDAISHSDSSRVGFGLGIDRLVRWIIGLDNVKKTVLFPRIGNGEGVK
jgi:asparaginyl-tRNA synthetase